MDYAAPAPGGRACYNSETVRPIDFEAKPTVKVVSGSQSEPRASAVLHRTCQPAQVASARSSTDENFETPFANGCTTLGGDTSHQARDCPTKGNPTCYNCGEQGHVSRECQAPQKEKTCYRCGQVGHLSRECMNDASAAGAGGPGGAMGGGGGMRGGQECYKCGQPGHIARNCTQGGGGSYGGGFGGGYGGGGGRGGGGQTCYTCGGFGHMSRDCTQGQKCYNCGEVGHVSRDCPAEASNERLCYRCKQPGHVQAACPN